MSQPTKYRKKPVVVEAMQYPKGYPEGVDPSSDGYAQNLQAVEVYRWVEQNTNGSFEPMAVIEGREPYPASGVSIDPRDGRMIISTLEGLHWVDSSDFIIRGVAGEFLPVQARDLRQNLRASRQGGPTMNPNQPDPRGDLAYYLNRLLDGEAWASDGFEAAQFIETALGWTHPVIKSSDSEAAS